jgi:hypothetical protein
LAGLLKLHDTPANFPINSRDDRIEGPCSLTAPRFKNLRNPADEIVVSANQRNEFSLFHSASLSFRWFHSDFCLSTVNQLKS